MRKSNRLPIPFEVPEPLTHEAEDSVLNAFGIRLPAEADSMLSAFRLLPGEREATIARFDRLLRLKSWETYRRLPTQLKIWMEPEDLYGEAYLEALRCYEVWDPTKSSFSTFVYRCVQNKLNSLVTHWTYKKRFPTSIVDVEIVDWETRPAGHEPFADPLLTAVFEADL